MKPEDVRILGLIPARGGSKGVPGKNIRLLAGRPLIGYTIRAAIGAKRVARTVVSTDDPQIAAIARELGADLPFLRPAELARDETPTLPVIQHAIRELEAGGERFDAVCLLQPTTPLRDSGLIDRCIEEFLRSEADSLVTILRVPEKYNPHWVYLRDEDSGIRISTGESHPIARRQDLPPAFHREGSVYITRRDVLIDGDSLYGARTIGVEVPAESSVNIDSPADWERAESLLTRLRGQRKTGGQA